MCVCVRDVCVCAFRNFFSTVYRSKTDELLFVVCFVSFVPSQWVLWLQLFASKKSNTIFFTCDNAQTLIRMRRDSSRMCLPIPANAAKQLVPRIHKNRKGSHIFTKETRKEGERKIKTQQCVCTSIHDLVLFESQTTSHTFQANNLFVIFNTKNK